MSFIAGPLRENVTAENVTFNYTPVMETEALDNGEYSRVQIQAKIEAMISDDGVDVPLELPYIYTLKDPDLEDQIKDAVVSLTPAGILTVSCDGATFADLTGDSVALTITVTLDDTDTDYTIDVSDLTQNGFLTLVESSEGEGGGGQS